MVKLPHTRAVGAPLTAVRRRGRGSFAVQLPSTRIIFFPFGDFFDNDGFFQSFEAFQAGCAQARCRVRGGESRGVAGYCRLTKKFFKFFREPRKGLKFFLDRTNNCICKVSEKAGESMMRIAILVLVVALMTAMTAATAMAAPGGKG